MGYSTISMNQHLLNKNNFLLRFMNKSHIKPYVSKTLYTYLSNIKKLIDDTKCNNEWDNKKKIINPYEYIHTIIPTIRYSVSTYKPLSRSFFKLIELVQTHYLLDEYTDQKINTFSLAEGPGGFIEALIKLRQNKKDKYYGITLLSDNKNIPGWKKSNSIIMNKQFRLIKGESKDGNILNYKNLEYCYTNYANSFHLITADGGFDFSLDFNNQEIMSSKLILAEVLYALLLQKLNGSFVLKVFDSFTLLLAEIIYLLSTFYEKVYISKPNTSRYANSEKYIICTKFKLPDSGVYYDTFLKILKQINENKQNVYSILSFRLPYNFIIKLEEINILLGQQQIETLLHTIDLIKNPTQYNIDDLINKNIEKCIIWCKKHKIDYRKQLEK